MSKTTWNVILQRAMAMPEGTHLRVRAGAGVLLLERRGDVLVALRELSRDQALASALTASPNIQAPWQLLKIDESLYLCDWRRQPADTGWLAAIADARP